jgi:hypothetical protein
MAPREIRCNFAAILNGPVSIQLVQPVSVDLNLAAISSACIDVNMNVDMLGVAVNEGD